MNREKVKEIKQALENCTNHYGTDCYHCPYLEKGCNIKLMEDSLILINELESENETIKLNIQETEKASFNINQMNGNLVFENQQLKDRIAELEKELETIKEEVLHLQEYGKKLIRETELKQFAERLKEKALSHCRTINCYELTFIETTVDELLKEYEK